MASSNTSTNVQPSITVTIPPQVRRLRLIPDENTSVETDADTETDTSVDQPVKKKTKNRVAWKEDVIDNENLNRKKSKICCIFHPNNEEEYECEHSHSEEEESESESSSDSSSDNDSDDDDDGDNNNNNNNNNSNDNNEHHEHTFHGPKNAYEYQPKYIKKTNL